MSPAEAIAILKRIESPAKTRFIYFLYRLLLFAAAPLLVLYFASRAWRDKRYRRHFSERLGSLRFSHEPTAAGAVWLHAASVGEILSAVPLINAIRTSCVKAPVFVSCATVAGRAVAEDKLAGLVDGLFYAPLDYVHCVRRVLRRVHPSLVIVMETEIWPNLYREVKRYGAALAIVNGRISDRALPRYQKLRWFFRAVLSHLDVLLVQSAQDLRRYIAIGGPPDKIEIGGNLKYDFHPGAAGIPAVIGDFVQSLKPARICIAASTMPPLEAEDPDEDDIVIGAFQEFAARDRELLLLLAPRRPERFASAAAKLEQSGVAYVRRSSLPTVRPPALPCVLLLDSIGELGSLFALADVVFMGGTLARRGGHNILEPASHAKAVVCGPHMENFAAIAAEFTDSGALVRVSKAPELANTLERLLRNREERETVGQRARKLAEAKRGVTERIASRLAGLYFTSLPFKRGSAWLAPLAAIWSWETRRRRDRALKAARRLEAPVISIGNITLGGAGKTPMTDWLATELRSQGYTPAILTRGYRRRSVEPCILLPAGRRAPADLTGDEAQLYLRRGAAHVGIASDRYECGRKLAHLFAADVFLLDDGFQHWRLARNADIVLIDALNPFGGGYVFPRGRLREPLEQLARASAFIITRVEPGIRTGPIETELRKWNSKAPIFRARIVPRQWVQAGTECRLDAPPFASVGAFCGLANPAAFWRTLDSLSVRTEFKWSFSDHHRYLGRELRLLSRHGQQHGVTALVTTEKDLANLCTGALKMIAPLKLYALEIGIEIEESARLMEFIHDILSLL